MASEASLTLVSVSRMSDEDIHRLCCALRWPRSDGSPECPHCGCGAFYRPRSRAIFVCKLCARQFRLTTGTDLAYHKLSLREYVFAAILYAHHPFERNAARFSTALGVQYRTASFLLSRFRLAALQRIEGSLAMERSPDTGLRHGADADGSIRIEACGGDAHLPSLRIPVRALMQAMLAPKSMRPSIGDFDRQPSAECERLTA